MDIALILDRLIPAGNWQGSVTENTFEAYKKIRWNDNRTKPTWEEVKAAWIIIKADIQTEDQEQEEKETYIAAMPDLVKILETRIAVLEAKEITP